MTAPAPAPIQTDTGRLYHVEIESNRRSECYIWASSKDEAKTAAGELSDDILDGAYPEQDIYVQETKGDRYKRSGLMVWTGGEDGDWEYAERWSPPDPEAFEERERTRPGPGQRDLFGGEIR